jgi:hypothetical protein
MASKISALIPSRYSILRAGAVIYLSSSLLWILIVVTGGTSILFEYLSSTILLPNQLITLRVRFGTWCLKSASLLICLKFFLGIVLAIQGYLETFTAGVSTSLQLHQLILLGFIGWIFLEGPGIYSLYESRFMNSAKEFESPFKGIGDDLVVNYPLVSPSEGFDLM